MWYRDTFRFFRTCKECGKHYRTNAKFSKLCDECKKPNAFGGIYKNELDKGERKQRRRRSKKWGSLIKLKIK